jgi:hypothetical protein
LHKGDFARDGLAAQLSYTCTAVKVHDQTLQNGQTVMGPENMGIEYDNSFTKACATNPTDPRCSTDVNHPAPAPCYTTTGVPDPTCAAMSGANPYWNSPIQNLESNSAFYPAMNQTFVGAGGAGNIWVTSSYVIPHVAALFAAIQTRIADHFPDVPALGGRKVGQSARELRHRSVLMREQPRGPCGRRDTPGHPLP